MSLTMKNNYLSKEELIFEYTLWLGKPTETPSVEVLRKRNKIINIKPSSKKLEGSLDFKTESHNIEVKLTMMTEGVENIKKN